MKKLIAKIRAAVEAYEHDPIQRNIDALEAKETLTDGQAQMLANLRSVQRGGSAFGSS